MNQEQKIYALMACAEDHQKLIDESIREFKNINQQELAKLAQAQRQLHENHNKFMNELLNIAKRTGEYNFKQLGWMWFVQTFVISLFIFVFFGGCFYWYVESKIDDIDRMNYTIEQLSQKGGEAEIRSCRRPNGKVYPCVRVMTKWGGYGEAGDLYIIDPK
ncbi:TPA: hypothetical protein ACN34R_004456 [Vibrio parahaemolyticus]